MQTEERGTSARSWQTLVWQGVAAVLVVCLVISQTWPPRETERETAPKTSNKVAPTKILPLVSRRPALQCFAVSPEHLAQMEELVRSMQHYVDFDDYEVVTAMHLGEASCALVLRLASGEALLMVNPRIRAYSVEAQVQRDEYSAACPEEKRHVARANALLVEFQSHKGPTMAMTLEGREAWAFQAGHAYLRGKSVCELSGAGADLGFADLEEAIKLF